MYAFANIDVLYNETTESSQPQPTATATVSAPPDNAPAPPNLESVEVEEAIEVVQPRRNVRYSLKTIQFAMITSKIEMREQHFTLILPTKLFSHVKKPRTYSNAQPRPTCPLLREWDRLVGLPSVFDPSPPRPNTSTSARLHR